MNHSIAEEDLTRYRAAADGAQVQNWSPYSGFPVVAALETIDGRTYGGSNIENANLSLTVHAEHSAIIGALADGALVRCGRKFIRRIYVRCASDGAPCGGCRQALNEFAADDCLWIGEDSRNDSLAYATLEELFPRNFGPTNLSVD